jgi:hypothetical protein
MESNPDIGIKKNTIFQRTLYYNINKVKKTHKSIVKYNGLIVDSDNKIICIPPPCPIYRETFTGINLDDYYIYPLNDGCTINLYWFDDRWIIATARGYDMTKVSWANNETFQEVFDKLVELYDFSYDKLDKSRTYTIGFKYLPYHPFIDSDEENYIGKMWYIQSSSLDEDTLGQVSYMDDIGIPKQSKLDITASDMQKNNVLALQDFEKSKTINYGYILKAKKPTYEEGYNEYVVPSTLFTAIQRFVYIRTHKFESNNKIKSIILRAFFDFKNRETFMKLFPQYKGDIIQIQSIIKKIIDKIIYISKTNNNGNSKIEKLAQFFYDEIGKKINYNNKNSRSLIFDFIVNQKYLSKYLELLNDK